jgi:threonyl-tRNA synthetase
MWDRAESMLRSTLDRAGVEHVEEPDEAAFYGPKIDIQVVDAAGREETLSTVQVDFLQPERFDLSYVDLDGRRQRPVMVHRSLVGSMERLFAYLIEIYQGAFPVWFAPVQLVVLPVGPAQRAVAAGYADRAVRAGLRARVEVDGSLAARVRRTARNRIPYAAVIGAREEADGVVSLRLRDGRAPDPMPSDAALRLIAGVAGARGHDLLPRGPALS